ncbi:MAG: PAS domain-containing protein, partial [Methermicoccaceae archaeon]
MEGESAITFKPAERALVLDSLSELVLYQDTEHRIIWANKAAAESVGLALHQLVGRHCYEIWHQRSTPCVDCPVNKALKTGQLCSGEISSSDGRTWLISGSPVRDENGSIVGMVETTV